MNSVITAAGRLTQLGGILVSGPDARTFLQGQLTCDVAQLTAGRIALASCNSAQGRVQAVTWLVERTEGVLLLVPAVMRDGLLQRLKKYVLRAKAQFDATGAGLAAFAGAGPSSLEPRAHVEADRISTIAWPGEPARTLLLAPAGHFGELPEHDAAWHLADIRAGLPQVYPPTHEAFVAQMLNLDVLGGISFEKGCYTGQEIIARAHFRGAVKRRMFAFRAACAPPAPGTRVLSGEQHAGDVVDAAEVTGGCELLAVISLAQREAELRLESGVVLEQMALPYAVVE